MFQIAVEKSFNATHALQYAGGTVEPVHGHDWHVTITIETDQLDADGLVVDFHEVEASLAALLEPMQHSHLNDLPAFADRNPSAEHVAEYIAVALGPTLPDRVRVARVQVTEAPGCVAAYLPPG